MSTLHAGDRCSKKVVNLRNVSEKSKSHVIAVSLNVFDSIHHIKKATVYTYALQINTLEDNWPVKVLPKYLNEIISLLNRFLNCDRKSVWSHFSFIRIVSMYYTCYQENRRKANMRLNPF